MIRKNVGLAIALVFFCLAFFNLRAEAQSNYIYTYNKADNSISAFSVNEKAVLSEISGSPFLTGTAEHGGGYISISPVTTLQAGNHFYIANAEAGTIAAFSIDPVFGTLVPVAGSPFPTSLKAQSSLAATPDDQFLFQGFLQPDILDQGLPSTITAFRITPDGSLIALSGFPLIIPGQLAHLQVSPDGKFLAVGQWASRAVAMFGIGSDGTLTTVPGSPFPMKDFGSAVRVRFNSAGNLLYVLKGGLSTVGVFTVDLNGALTLVSNIPLLALGGNPSDILLTPNDQYLFACDLENSLIHAFRLTPEGSFSKIPGSPFDNPGGRQPHLLATNQAGTLLFLANLNSKLTVFDIAADGTLTTVGKSPFEIGRLGPSFVAAYPPSSGDLKIIGIELKGKKLFVTGQNFDAGAVILINGKEQKTQNDEVNWTSRLIGKKAGKKIDDSQAVTIQIRNSNGRLSQEVIFKRSSNIQANLSAHLEGQSYTRPLQVARF